MLNAKGAKRVIGGHIEVIDDLELVLIGPDLYHTWLTNTCQNEKIIETTIQFHKDLFDEKFLKRNQLSFLKNMLEHAQRGIVFAPETVLALKDRIQSLDKKTDSILYLNYYPYCTNYLQTGMPEHCVIRALPARKFITTAGGLRRCLSI